MLSGIQVNVSKKMYKKRIEYSTGFHVWGDLPLMNMCQMIKFYFSFSKYSVCWCLKCAFL